MYEKTFYCIVLDVNDDYTTLVLTDTRKKRKPRNKTKAYRKGEIYYHYFNTMKEAIRTADEWSDALRIRYEIKEGVQDVS